MRRPAADRRRRPARRARSAAPARSPRWGSRRAAGSSRVERLRRQPPAPSRPPAAATSASRASSSSAGQLAVAAGAEHRPATASPAAVDRAARGEQHGVAQRAREPRLVAVGEHVAADVDAARRGRSPAAARRRRGRRRPRRGPGWGRRSTHGLAEELGHARLGEAEASRAACLRARERDRGVEALARRRSRRGGAGPGSGSIGRRSQVMPPTTTSAPRRAGGLGHGQRADDVAAAADADGTGARRAPPSSGVDAGRCESAWLDGDAGASRSRSPRSPRSRARTPRRRAPACPRTAGRGGSRATSGSRRTRRAPDGHRPRDAVGAQHEDVQRVAALPGQPLLRVVRRPHVERRERVDAARVGDRVVRGDLGPRADAHAVGLGDAAVHGSAPPAAARRRPTRPPRARAGARGCATRGPGRRAGGRTSGRGRSARARGESACSASRIPPLRRVRSCSPSASARTVTAHSLNAIGIEPVREKKS